jgi:hypothetical protein
MHLPRKPSAQTTPTVKGQTAQVLSLIGRIGAYSLHAKYDPRETTAAARRTFLSRFELEVDPDSKLPTVERLRRAESARKAYFARLAFKSVQARRAARKSGGGGDE